MSKPSIKTISWYDFNSIFKDRFGFTFSSLDKTLDNLLTGELQIEWKNIDNWEDLEDIEIFEQLPKLERMEDNLYIVTEASYKDNVGPFEVSSDSVKELIADHLERYSECFFNGDVLITNVNSGYMWVFHHSGVMTFIEAFNHKQDKP